VRERERERGVSETVKIGGRFGEIGAQFSVFFQPFHTTTFGGRKEEIGGPFHTVGKKGNVFLG